jgi:hypothetical protein
MGHARRRCDSLDAWFYRRRREWLRCWRWTLVAVGSVVVLHLVVAGWLVYCTGIINSGGLSAHPLCGHIMKYWDLREALGRALPIASSVLMLIALCLAAVLGRAMLQLPAELISALPGGEIYRLSRRALLRNELLLFGTVALPPALVVACFEISQDIVSHASYRSTQLYGGTLGNYIIPDLPLDLLYTACYLLFVSSAQALLLLRWPRLALYWHILSVFGAVALYAALNTTAVDALTFAWNLLRAHPSWVWDTLGFTLLAAAGILPPLLLLRASARPPARFNGALLA